MNNMMQVIQQTDEEKRAMYMKLPKEEIISMLIQCNKIIDSGMDKIKKPYSPSVAKNLLKLRDAVLHYDIDEVYFCLFAIASNDLVKYSDEMYDIIRDDLQKMYHDYMGWVKYSNDVWNEMEAIANEKTVQVTDQLPPQHPFIDVLIENTDCAARDEGIYFADSIRWDEEKTAWFEKMINEYKIKYNIK